MNEKLIKNIVTTLKTNTLDKRLYPILMYESTHKGNTTFGLVKKINRSWSKTASPELHTMINLLIYWDNSFRGYDYYFRLYKKATEIYHKQLKRTH